MFINDEDTDLTQNPGGEMGPAEGATPAAPADEEEEEKANEDGSSDEAA